MTGLCAICGYPIPADQIRFGWVEQGQPRLRMVCPSCGMVTVVDERGDLVAPPQEE